MWNKFGKWVLLTLFPKVYDEVWRLARHTVVEAADEALHTKLQECHVKAEQIGYDKGCLEGHIEGLKVGHVEGFTAGLCEGVWSCAVNGHEFFGENNNLRSTEDVTRFIDQIVLQQLKREEMPEGLTSKEWVMRFQEAIAIDPEHRHPYSYISEGR